MYRLSAFYFARTASDLPMELSLPAGYLIISYFMSGLRRDAGAFFANLLGSLLVTLVRPVTHRWPPGLNKQFSLSECSCRQ